MNSPLGIQVIDNAILNCDEIIKHLDSLNNWQPSFVIGNSGTLDKARTSETTFVPMLSWNNDPIIHEMNRVVWQSIDNYAQEHDFSFTGIEDVSIQRYQIGDFYKAHTDHDISNPRIVSAVAYLNTVEIGGETRFTRFDYKVKPVAGRIAIFPANYIYAHEALAPVSGVKVAAAYWARG